MEEQYLEAHEVTTFSAASFPSARNRCSAPPVDSDWAYGVFDCFSDCSVCCLTCWCPCVTFGRIAEIIDKRSSSCRVNGAIYCAIWLSGCAFLYSCAYRFKMRKQYHLEESPCRDSLVHFFCEGCALCQEYRELLSRGINMSQGWQGNGDVQNREMSSITTAPEHLKLNEAALETSANSGSVRENNLSIKTEEQESPIEQVKIAPVQGYKHTNRKEETCPEKKLNIPTSHASDAGNLTELLSEVTFLKEKNRRMETELKEMQERYSEISLKFAEVEGERQKLVMTVRNLKNGKKN
ncbi:hypothetical protein Q3G72_002902 [Acer saccharum]|nr:hypothetical protein Q3G72_002902 [Acer saccharum]